MDICNHLRGSLRSSRDDYRILAQKEPMESRRRRRSDVQRNVVGARIWLFTIKLIGGKASEEEKKI
jgi:hypothetical protein